MSPTSTTSHHHSRCPQLHHSATRSGEASSLRLARLVAGLSNGINQQTPEQRVALVIRLATAIATAASIGLVS